MDRSMREFSVITLEDEGGGYVAIVRELPRCHTQGDSLDEAIRNVRKQQSYTLKHSPRRKRRRLSEGEC